MIIVISVLCDHANLFAQGDTNNETMFSLQHVEILKNEDAKVSSLLLSSYRDTIKDIDDMHDILKHGMGISGGWGTHYGYGLEYIYRPSLDIDINFGVGLSLSGIRTGMGLRYYFDPIGSSWYFGGNLIYGTGVGSLNIMTDVESATYSIPDNWAGFIRGGYKLEILDKLNLLMSAGYGIRITQYDVEFISGSTSDSIRDAIEIHNIGGIELSVTVLAWF